jgi:hypothetical protein
VNDFDNYNAIALDAAFRRVAVLDFEIPNRFVNHGPMACEALDALGLASELDHWARSFAGTVPSSARTVAALKDGTFDWENALGDYRMLPQWIALFEHAIRDDGWREVVATWTPRLVPGLASALFHGSIRTAHAVRAVSRADTSARRAELARALAHWSIWFEPGQDVSGIVQVDDISMAVTDAAARGALCYATDPNAFTLHGVTGAMAIEILTQHMAPDVGLTALAQLHAEHRLLYGRGIEMVVEPADRSWNESVETLAARSLDSHQIKLVEACKRGFQITGGEAFLMASGTVTDQPEP